MKKPVISDTSVTVKAKTDRDGYPYYDIFKTLVDTNHYDKFVSEIESLLSAGFFDRRDERLAAQHFVESWKQGTVRVGPAVTK